MAHAPGIPLEKSANWLSARIPRPRTRLTLAATPSRRRRSVHQRGPAAFRWRRATRTQSKTLAKWTTRARAVFGKQHRVARQASVGRVHAQTRSCLTLGLAKSSDAHSIQTLQRHA